ncbi:MULTISPECIES: hypothetical protein [Falsihalocynthiibacter]|uniref:hypothetical protein n=1 Tax=Falsihalocynthiibacter TaxID=2854182 RepID=UPI003002E66F
MRDSENNPNILQALWLRLKRVGSSIATYKPGIFVKVVMTFLVCWYFYRNSQSIWSPKLESLDPDIRRLGYVELCVYTASPVLSWLVLRLFDLIPNPFERFAKSRKTKGSPPK